MVVVDLYGLFAGEGGPFGDRIGDDSWGPPVFFAELVEALDTGVALEGGEDCGEAVDLFRGWVLGDAGMPGGEASIEQNYDPGRYHLS